MVIYPDHDKVDGFIVHLTSQELANLQQGISTTPTPYIANSPWSRGTFAQMQQAIDDNKEYRSKKWE